MRRLVKMEDKLQKSHFKNSNLLIGQELWQAYCQTLLVILLKEFIKLNVNLNIIIKSVKRIELNKNTVNAVMNTQTIKKK